MIAIICWGIAASAGLPLVMLTLETMLGVLPDRLRAYGPATPFTVIIPAHDEAGGIAKVIQAVRAQLRAGDRVMVIADNCTDGTASIARAEGAEVVERGDEHRRGKAYALAFGRQALLTDPPVTIIVVDADCLPAPDALSRLAAHASFYGAAVQGCYLLTTPADATPLVRISNLAFLIKNLVRQRGLERLGGGALLQGTGMAFPWSIFEQASLETDSLVEDMQLGLELRLAGEMVRFDPQARFYSAASAQSATQGQRTRWEHGSVTTALRYAPRLVLAGLWGRPALLLLATDLMIPPLAMLVIYALTASLLLASMALLGASILPLLALLTAGAASAAAISLIWFSLGRDILPAQMAVQVPRYLLWKLPIYRRLVGARQRSWVRTSREP
jgi:cellulose synthase/poly-beta-1,6-N-acetylglucosamine synthase-like glycosyltransferase